MGVRDQVAFNIGLAESAVGDKPVAALLQRPIGWGGPHGENKAGCALFGVGGSQVRAGDAAGETFVDRKTGVGSDNRVVVHRVDGYIKGWALRLIVERIETAGDGVNPNGVGPVRIAEGEAVGGGLTAVMRIRHQAVVDVILGKGVLVGERCPVQLQVPIRRGAEDIEYQLGGRVIHVRQAQGGGGQGAGGPLVDRQPGVGKYRCVVLRRDGDVEGRWPRASLCAVGDGDGKAVGGGFTVVMGVRDQVAFNIGLAESAVGDKPVAALLQRPIGWGGPHGENKAGCALFGVGGSQVRAGDAAGEAFVDRQSGVGSDNRIVVHRGDGDLEAEWLRTPERIEPAVGGVNANADSPVGIAEGEAVGGGLAAVVGVRHQVVVDVILGKGVLAGKRGPVKLQVSICRGAEDIKYQLGGRVIHVRQAQLRSGQGAGAPFVDRQTGVGQYRCVVLRRDGDVERRWPRASLRAVGDGDGKAVGGGLTVVMGVRDQVAFNIGLAESAVGDKPVAALLQSPVDRGGPHGENKAGGALLGVDGRQVCAGDAVGEAFVDRQAGVGINSGIVVLRRDGDGARVRGAPAVLVGQGEGDRAGSARSGGVVGGAAVQDGLNQFLDDGAGGAAGEVHGQFVAGRHHPVVGGAAAF